MEVDDEREQGEFDLPDLPDGRDAVRRRTAAAPPAMIVATHTDNLRDGAQGYRQADEDDEGPIAPWQRRQVAQMRERLAEGAGRCARAWSRPLQRTGEAMHIAVWLTVPDAAEYAGLKRDTIYNACERGDLRHVRVGGRRAIRLRREWIDAWLEQHARGGKVASKDETMNGKPVDDSERPSNTHIGDDRMDGPRTKASR